MVLLFNLALMLVMAGALAFANFKFDSRNRESYNYIFDLAPESAETTI